MKLIGWVLVQLVAIIAFATASGVHADAATVRHWYDLPTAQRVEAPAFGAVATAPLVLNGLLGQYASPSLDDRGESTASVSAVVATNSAGAVDVVPSSGKTFVGTPRGTVYDVPEGWTHRVADSGKGSVYQRPGATGNQDMIRIMEPTPKYPDGYARVYNNQAPNGQPIDVFGNPGPPPATHIPETYRGPWPAWPQ